MVDISEFLFVVLSTLGEDSLLTETSGRVAAQLTD